MTLRTTRLERIRRVKRSMQELASLRLSLLERGLVEAQTALSDSRAAMDRSMDCSGILIAGATNRLLTMATKVEIAKSECKAQLQSALTEASHEKALARLATNATRIDAAKIERERLIDIIDQWSARSAASSE